jgi:1,2-phenylacetyl-CoA epoxidase PaaB subunit
MPRYLIFARTRYEDPLALEGDLEAQDAQDAARAARAEFGQGSVEVQLVPEDAVRWVIRPSGGERQHREEVAGV